MFFPTYPHLEKTGHDWSATSLSRFPHSMQLQPRLLRNSCNRQPQSTRNWLRFSSVASLLSVWQLDFKTLLMRRVRGGQVGGESETGHGWGQTITRSIEAALKTLPSRGTEDIFGRRGVIERSVITFRKIGGGGLGNILRQIVQWEGPK